MFEFIMSILTAIINFFKSFFVKSDKHVNFTEDTKKESVEEIAQPEESSQ